MVLAILAELVKDTEEAKDGALIGSEDLLQHLRDRDLHDWIGADETDSNPGAGDTSETEDKESDDTPEPCSTTGTGGLNVARHDFNQSAYNTAADNDGPEEDKDSPTATRAVCLGARYEVVSRSISAGGRETDSLGARHRGGDLDADELEGLERLERAFVELKSHMTKAWDDAMISIEDKLVFTELDTLMTVAREAADRVIETSTRFTREARDEVPEILGAQERKKPSRTEPTKLPGEDA